MRGKQRCPEILEARASERSTDGGARGVDSQIRANYGEIVVNVAFGSSLLLTYTTTGLEVAVVIRQAMKDAIPVSLIVLKGRFPAHWQYRAMLFCCAFFFLFGL